jgi:hypothetical protein
MKIRKHKLIIMLSLPILAVQFDAYGQSTGDVPQNGIGPSDQHSIYGRFMELISRILPLDEMSGTLVSGAQHSAPNIKDPGRPFKANPFMPLTANNQNAMNKLSIISEPAPVKPESCPVLLLTATFTVTDSRRNEPAAIVEENGESLSVSVGDKIAGMTIVKIKRAEVILSKGDKKCVMKLGLPPEEITANGL